MSIATRRIRANGLDFQIDEAGSGNDVALCLHGFPENRFSWRFQLPFLAARGWHAVAPDLRGYGDSDRPEAQAAYHIDHLCADVEAMFDVLGARRRLLIAHDWGAVIAWMVALRGRIALDGLVIMNVPHPTVFSRVLRRSPRQMARSWYVLFFQLPGLPERLMTANRARRVAGAFLGMAVDKSAFPREVLDHYREAALKPGAMTAMLSYYRANAKRLAERRSFPPIAVPTLMIWGEEDRALGLELTEGYEELVTDFTLRRLPRVSHWVQQEAPEKVNQALGAWLDAKALAPG
jgi:pimeloyl-ACP methyl ester carboxylesterase